MRVYQWLRMHRYNKIFLFRRRQNIVQVPQHKRDTVHVSPFLVYLFESDSNHYRVRDAVLLIAGRHAS